MMNVALQIAVVAITVAGSHAAPPTLWFVCDRANDFVDAVDRGTGGVSARNVSSVSAALASATKGDGLLVIAEAMLPSNPGHPQSGTGTNVSASEWSQIQALGLRVYIEVRL